MTDFGFFFIYSSAQRCPSTTMVSEPLTVTAAARAGAEAPAMPRNRKADAIAVAPILIFIVRFSLCRCTLFSKGDGQAEQELLIARAREGLDLGGGIGALIEVVVDVVERGPEALRPPVVHPQLEGRHLGATE